VLALAAEVRAAAAKVADPAAKLADPGLQWVLERALAKDHLPMNGSSVASLRAILAAL
jgi:hypothetical protein